MKINLSDRQKQNLSQAIKTAEENTAGEIYCVVARRSGNYASFTILTAWILALIIPAIIVSLDLDIVFYDLTRNLTSNWQSAHIYDDLNNFNLYALFILQLLIFVIMAFVVKSKIYMPILPHALKERTVHDKAMAQFGAHGIEETQDKTGVLVYVSLEEHIVEIIADKGINDNVAAGFWDKANAIITNQIKAGDFEKGLTKGIQEIGNELVRYFPKKFDDNDELDDSVIFI